MASPLSISIAPSPFSATKASPSEVEDDAGDRPALFDESDADAEKGHAPREIGGSVDRIDQECAAGATRNRGLFLAGDRVVREAGESARRCIARSDAMSAAVWKSRAPFSVRRSRSCLPTERRDRLRAGHRRLQHGTGPRRRGDGGEGERSL